MWHYLPLWGRNIPPLPPSDRWSVGSSAKANQHKTTQGLNCNAYFNAARLQCIIMETTMTKKTKRHGALTSWISPSFSLKTASKEWICTCGRQIQWQYSKQELIIMTRADCNNEWAHFFEEGSWGVLPQTFKGEQQEVWTTERWHASEDSHWAAEWEDVITES